MGERLQTRADCDRCAALCCIAYPSDEMPGFSAQKQAGEPCPKLGRDGLCTIYDCRAEKGFAGCIRFECFGAGQHVVQTLFGGHDWRDDPILLRPMVETFLAMRPVSDAAYLVERAIRAATDDESRNELFSLRNELSDIASSLENLADRGRLARCQARIKVIYASIDPVTIRHD